MQISPALRSDQIFHATLFTWDSETYLILVDLGTKYLFSYSTARIYWEKNTDLKKEWIMSTDKTFASPPPPLAKSIPFYFYFYLSRSFSKKKKKLEKGGAGVEMSYCSNLFYRRKRTLNILVRLMVVNLIIFFSKLPGSFLLFLISAHPGIKKPNLCPDFGFP